MNRCSIPIKSFFCLETSHNVSLPYLSDETPSKRLVSTLPSESLVTSGQPEKKTRVVNEELDCNPQEATEDTPTTITNSSHSTCIDYNDADTPSIAVRETSATIDQEDASISVPKMVSFDVGIDISS